MHEVECGARFLPDVPRSSWRGGWLIFVANPGYTMLA